MKTKQLLMMVLLGIAVGAQAASVKINKTNFPDQNFRNWILQNYNADGVLTDAIIAEVKEINVSYCEISDLTGIEHFTALEFLLCYGNQLTTLDISKNTKLHYVNCDDNQLTALDVSYNSELGGLYCGSNQLSTLNVSKNPVLEYLSCPYNQIRTLDVSKNTELKGLFCFDNQLTTLDVSKNTVLRELHCENNQLKALDVSKNTELNSLWCYGNRIRGEDMNTFVNCLFDRSGFVYGELYVYWDETAFGNEMTPQQVVVAKGKNWQVMMWDNGSMRWVDYPGTDPSVDPGVDPVVGSDVTIDKTNFPDENFRTYVSKNCDPDMNGIISASEIAEVEVIDVYNMGISNLKGIEFFTALRKLYCDHNQLTALDLSKNTALVKLDCGYNQLTTLDVSKNTELEYLYCYYNQLTALDISNNTVLDWVDCSCNRIRGEGMNKLVNSLLDRSATWNGSLFVYNNESATGNEMTAEQVAVAKAKNWRVLMFSDNDWVDYPSGAATIASVTLNKKEAILKKKKTLTLKATVYPETLEDKSVTWKSSDKAIATVSKDGVVTGVKSGFVTITCTSVATGAKATCKVTVGTISLNKSSVTINEGKTVTLKPTVYPTTLEDQSVKWKSSDKTIATVTSAGKVKGVKAGTATITCTSNATGLSTTCKVTVAAAASVTLDQSDVILKKKKTLTLKATVYPETLEDKSVTWESSDETVATVSTSGKVTGVKSGVVTITCTSVATGAKATCKVTVATITLSKSNVVVKKKKTVTLTPTVYPSSLEDKSVTWESSDESIATVSGDGVVTGIKSGFVTITCTSNATGLSTTCKVTVATIALSKSSATITVGKTVTLKPTVYPTTLEDQSVTWKSSNKAVATVKNGKVTGVAAGTATITCTAVATGVSTTCKVTVKAASARILDGDDDELTDIEIVEVTPAVVEPFDVYDLRGHRVLHQVTSLDGLPAGVYIVNGKKMMKR